MEYRDLDPQQAAEAIASDDGLVILDVRTSPEFVRHRIHGARLLPVQDLPSQLARLDPDQSYLVVCEHGIRSVAACEFLAQHDFGDLRNLTGGMAHWLAADLPFESGPA